MSAWQPNKEKAPRTPPVFCNNCGERLALVRPWPVYNIYEFHCGHCEYYAVVHSYDQMGLPSAEMPIVL